LAYSVKLFSPKSSPLSQGIRYGLQFTDFGSIKGWLNVGFLQLVEQRGLTLMVAFFSIVVAVLLLGITVFGLHKYQNMHVEYSTDRSSRLPQGDDEVSEPREQGQLQGRLSSSQNRELDGKKQRARRQKKLRNQFPRNDNETQPGVRNWLDDVTELKTRGELNAALTRCQQEFPLWGAYNQACIIIRSLIRRGQAGSEEEIKLLKELYDLAATAELLHDKSEAEEALSLGQIKQMDLRRLESLEHPYEHIGYAYLRLIRKSDIKLMQTRWGRPREHQLPRQYHEKLWQQITTASQS
jgi:hypothetical protein